MKFFIDNNLSHQLARGMAAFGEDVVHLRDEFDHDAPDTVWLPVIGKRGMILLTRDQAIRRRPAELMALIDYKVGAFFLAGKQRTGWQLVEQLVRNWRRINEHAEKTQRPPEHARCVHHFTF